MGRLGQPGIAAARDFRRELDLGLCLRPSIGRMLCQPSAKGFKAWCVVACQIAENINDALLGSRVRVLDIERATFEAIAA